VAESIEDEGAPDYQERSDAFLAELTDGAEATEVALALAVVINRAATRLHNLGRAEAQARKGQAEWASWAGLQNAARAAVLQASTCRDLAARLAGRRR
jgi:hypothetical protein